VSTVLTSTPKHAGHTSFCITNPLKALRLTDTRACSAQQWRLKVFIGSEHYFVKGGIGGLIDISMSGTLNVFMQFHPARVANFWLALVA
jgi:hypothetical protein